jgi:hypothetical protein
LCSVDGAGDWGRDTVVREIDRLVAFSTVLGERQSSADDEYGCGRDCRRAHQQLRSS